MKSNKQEWKKRYNLGKVRTAKYCWVLEPLSLIILQTTRHTVKRALEMKGTFLISSTNTSRNILRCDIYLARRTV